MQGSLGSRTRQCRSSQFPPARRRVAHLSATSSPSSKERRCWKPGQTGWQPSSPAPWPPMSPASARTAGSGESHVRVPPIPCPHVIRSSVAMTSRLALVVDVGRAGADGCLRRSPALSAEQHPAARRRCMQDRESTSGAGSRQGYDLLSGLPCIHAYPLSGEREDRRRRGRRWGEVRPFVGPALDTRVPAVPATTAGRGAPRRCSANLGGDWRPVVCRGCGCRSRDTSRT